MRIPRPASCAAIARVCAGGDRRHVDAQHPGRGAGRNAIRADQRLVHLLAVDDHRDDDVAGGADLGRRGRDSAPVLGDPRLGLGAGAVVDGQLVPGAGQIRRLARSHDPEADEADAVAGGVGHRGRC